MVVCSVCEQDLPKADFSGAQLKKKNDKKKSCSTCVAAAALAEVVLANPPPVSSEDMPADYDMAAAQVGYRVEESVAGSRSLIATRDFAEGELVLREPPALVFSPDNAEEFLGAFLGASPAAQASILKMATPALDSDLDAVSASEREAILAARRTRAAARTALATPLAGQYEGSTRILELVEALLLIADCNAHAFEERVGLFPTAALANHSCNPSCGHGTRVAGEMRFWANRSLSTGEEITISYLPALFSTPREARRRQLMLEKLFYCRCPRCVGIDSCRGLHCVTACCDGVAERRDSGQWHCGKCKSDHAQSEMGPSMEAEDALIKRASALQPATTGTLTTAQVLAAVQSVRDDLSPSHHLAPELLSRIFEIHPPPPPRERAAVAAQALATLECAASGCHSLKCARHGVTRHPPCAELVGEAVTAALACASGGTKELVGLAGVISSRYLPWAVRAFGPEDTSVRTMQKVLDLVAPNAVKSGIVEEEIKELQ